jgi:diguanylate cyclase (GGDEF)-like protein/PAS domain S-box-containing protein
VTKKLFLWLVILTVSAISALLLSAMLYPAHLLVVIAFIFVIFSSMMLCRQLIAIRNKVGELNNQQTVLSARLYDYQARFETLFDTSNFGIALVNMDGTFVKTNRTFCDLFNYTDAELHNLNLFQLMHAADINNVQAFMQQLTDNKMASYQMELQCCQKGGDNIWAIITISLTRDNQSRPNYYIVQLQNISPQKKAEEKLRHMAYHDHLTGLANRNKLEQFVSHILASSRRHQQNFALLFLDLDRFKNINDTIGHEAGDALLQIIAERLRSTVRNTDLVARLGGDEFVLVITDVKRTESVALIAQKILDTVLQAIVIKGQELYITTSIGISLYPYDGQNMQALMKNADLALYRAKDHGRNNYQFYTVEMTGRAHERMALQNTLAHALAKNEFFLHYQPKMSIDTRSITGVEALLRWQNKEYGMITPDEIVSLAEETGLIIPVSDWVLETAARELKVLHDKGFTSLTMAVNCSSRQFKQATFADDVLNTITRIGIPAASLEIEVTEKLIMEDPENTLRVLYALKDLGVKIVIDDFGTGYWSLNNLRRLAVDKIKIDKSFIKQATVDETSAAISSAIIAMVNKLGIVSVAEGVETREQYEFLIREGCMEIQGYYLAKPLSATDLSKFINHPIPAGEVMSSELETQ